MSFKIKVYKNRSFKDKRGYYWTSWKKKQVKNLEFIHDKFSLSKKNVLRGLHGDKKTWKLISCPYGKLFLVVVNCIKNSKDYLKWKSYILSHKNGLQVLVPPNYANGHYCLSKVLKSCATSPAPTPPPSLTTRSRPPSPGGPTS